MKLLPALPVLWGSLLILRVSQSEAESSDLDVCHGVDSVYVLDSAGLEDYSDVDELEETFNCLLVLPNLLNCSWSIQGEQWDDNTQLSVHISVCEGNTPINSKSQTSVKRVGSVTWTLPKQEIQSVILKLNISRPDEWKTYTYTYEKKILMPVPPPANVSALIIDGSLHVKWDLSCKDLSSNTECFEYQLDTGNQENLTCFRGGLSYTEPNADPSLNYRIRMRTRVLHEICIGPRHWSAWSDAVTVEQSLHSFDRLVIVSISLGIPMMLLATLLLVRSQRLSKVLFPPIPHPPPKYKNFLERNDQTNLYMYCPTPSAKIEEEITEVEEAEQNPGQTS